MNRNYLTAAAIAAVVFCLLFFTFRFFFVISPSTTRLPPSREARTNEYLALDRWLKGMGIPVRVESYGDLSTISRAKEKNIYIQASLFDWTDEAVEYLASWIEDGGNLILDEGWFYYEPEMLLEEFGIQYQDGFTDFAEVKRGEGKIVALKDSDFMRSSSLDDESNIRLAWTLFASEPYPLESGWLFIRGKAKVRGLLGTIFQQGNFTVLLVSVLVLLVVCFWAEIPGFGLVKWENEKPSRPLKERFLAEGRFLKRYGALDFYSRVYIREIKRRLAFREGINGDEESLKRILEIYEGRQEKPEKEKAGNLIVKAFRKEPFSFREFPDLINVFRNILKFFGNFSF